MTLIGVKSKYGSCSRNCTGLINVNNIPYHKKTFVLHKIYFFFNHNIMHIDIFLAPYLFLLSLYSSMVERDTVNVLIHVRFMLRAFAFFFIIIPLFLIKKRKRERNQGSVLTQWLEYCATVTKVISSNLIHVYITKTKIKQYYLLCFSFSWDML